MSNHTYVINILSDELERTLRDILYIRRCIVNVENHIKKGAPFPATHQYQATRLRRRLKDQLKAAEKIGAAIKTLEEDN